MKKMKKTRTEKLREVATLFAGTDHPVVVVRKKKKPRPDARMARPVLPTVPSAG